MQTSACCPDPLGRSIGAKTANSVSDCYGQGIVRSAGGSDPICETQFDVDSKAKEQNYLDSAADLKGLYIHGKVRSVLRKAWSL